METRGNRKFGVGPTNSANSTLAGTSSSVTGPGPNEDEELPTNNAAGTDVGGGSDAHPISELKGPGITEADVQKLYESGFRTIASVIASSKRKLLEVKGLSDPKIDKLKNAATKVAPIKFFENALDILNKRKEVIYITTGSNEFDAALRGGIETGTVTEMYGAAGCGKSQIGMMMAVNCQLPVAFKGAEGTCLYIDTCNSFRPERIIDFVERYKDKVPGIERTSVLRNIYTASVSSTDQLNQVCIEASSLCLESRCALIVVDSVTELFRREFSGRGELNARQIELQKLLATLRRLADIHGPAILLTNQVYDQVDGKGFFADPKTPVGGNVLAHAVTTRVYIRKSRGTTRIAKIIASPHLPVCEAQFDITCDGIVDVSDPMETN